MDPNLVFFEIKKQREVCKNSLCTRQVTPTFSALDGSEGGKKYLFRLNKNHFHLSSRLYIGFCQNYVTNQKKKCPSIIRVFQNTPKSKTVSSKGVSGWSENFLFPTLSAGQLSRFSSLGDEKEMWWESCAVIILPPELLNYWAFFISEQIKMHLKAILTANRLSALGMSDQRCGLMELAFKSRNQEKNWEKR